MNYTKVAIKRYAYLAISLLLLIILLPANRAVMEMYRISADQYKVLLFLVELPLLAIWFFAFYSYSRLQSYAALLQDAPEAAGFKRLATGFQILALGLAVPTIIGLVINAIAGRHSSLHGAAIIFNTYFSLSFSVAAFATIGSAVHLLAQASKLKIKAGRLHGVQALFIVMGIVYCYVTLRRFDTASLGSSNNPYYLPVWLFVVSIVVPSLCAWFIGLIAAYNLGLLAQNAKGILYRSALGSLSAGMVLVIGCLIAAQYARSITPRVGHLSLNKTLAFTYSVYIIAIIGFVLMNYGASRLKQIEEV